jgi:hypothetical protein
MARKTYVTADTWGLTVVRIERLLRNSPGMTSSELAMHLGIDANNVRSVISRMRRASKREPKRLYIPGYRRLASDSKRSYLRAVYALGDKPDARKPPSIRSSMTKLTHDKAAAVDPGYHWIPVGPDTPRGTKLQLINRTLGVAVYGQYTPGMNWTHWAPLPTFKD